MTVDPNKAPQSADRKIQMPADSEQSHHKSLFKSRSFLKSTSILYPILLALILIIGTTLLVITVTRRNTCRQAQEERIASPLGLVADDHVC